MDKTAMRFAESNLLRAEAAVERHNAVRARSGSSFMDEDTESAELSSELHARVSEARAELLECQAEWVLHGDDGPDQTTPKESP